MTIALILLSLGLVILLTLYIVTQNLAQQAVRAVPQAGKLQPVPGGMIHYVEFGPKDAPPIVMIHGLSAQLQHFTYALTDLLKDDFSLIVLDRPGCGYSSRDSADLVVQARMIGALLDELGIDRPVVAGHSLGGALALAIALERPVRTGALALLAPATQVAADVHPIFKPLTVRSPLLRRVIANTIAAPMGKLTLDKVLAHAFAPEPFPADFMTRAGAALGLRPKGFVSASEDLVMMESAMPRQVARYGDLVVPGGVLFGTDDALLAADVHGAPMAAFGLVYETLPRRGHMIPLTAPEDCADFIRRMAVLRG